MNAVPIFLYDEVPFRIECFIKILRPYMVKRTSKVSTVFSLKGKIEKLSRFNKKDHVLCLPKSITLKLQAPKLNAT